MHAVLLGLAAAFGTITGLFLGMPIMGFVLWPVTRALCRLARIEIDANNEDDPIMKLEGSFAAGLGMALGVAATVLLVGVPSQAPGVITAATASALVAGMMFGSFWSFGYARRSASPLVLATAALAGFTATLAAWPW